MHTSGTQLSGVGSLLTTESQKHAAPPDWALRVGEVIELLTEAMEEGDNAVKISEAKSLLENMQAELVNELMEAA
jgi:hypothetical protein